MCHIYWHIINLHNRIKVKFNIRLNKIQIQIDFLIKKPLIFCPVKKSTIIFGILIFSQKIFMSR